MKQLLMIVPFFPPMAGGGVYRPLSFVKYLELYGWQATVVTPKGDAFWIRDEGLTAQVPKSCDVVRTRVMSGQALLAGLRRAKGRPGATSKRSSRLFSFMRRVAAGVLLPDTYVGWYPYALKAAIEAAGKKSFEALYSTSPPETSHLIALRIHDATGLPWVADFRDPWMNLYLLPPPTRLHAALHRRMEKRVCRRAHAVVTTLWQESLLRERYPFLKSVTRIPNGYDGFEVESVKDLAPEPGRFHMLHAGMLTQKRSALPFLRGLKMFLDGRPDARRRVLVTFVGPREDRNEKVVQSLGLRDTVEFRDAVSHEETLKLEKRAHILLLIKHSNPAYAGIVPGKLYEYVGLRRPVLGLVPDGEAKDRIRELRIGEVVEQDDAGSIAGKIGELYERYLDGTLDGAYDLSARPHLERSSLAGDLARLLDGLAGPKAD